MCCNFTLFFCSYQFCFITHADAILCFGVQLSRHEEAIALCQKTLDFAEKNFMAVTPENYEVDESSTDVRMWRYRTLSKCHFHLGNLEAACDLLEKQE